MQTVWIGAALPSFSSGGSTEGLEGLTPQSCTVVLSAIPSSDVLQVALPFGTHQVWLWTPLERVWYALDTFPGPIPPPVQGPVGVLPSSTFAPGAVLMPGQWQALPMDATGSHVLGLVSEAESPTVFLTAWVD